MRRSIQAMAMLLVLPVLPVPAAPATAAELEGVTLPEVRIGGDSKGTLPGKPFADALLGCWLGPEPPSRDFKRDLLGG